MDHADHVDSIEVCVAGHLAMAEHARAEFPRECCGILIGRRLGRSVHVERIVRAENVTGGDPVASYQVDFKTLIATRRELRGGASSIVGFYHSHPDGTWQPSRRDREFAWAGHVYLIVPIRRAKVGQPAAWYACGGVDGPGAMGRFIEVGGRRRERGSASR